MNELMTNLPFPMTALRDLAAALQTEAEEYAERFLPTSFSMDTDVTDAIQTWEALSVIQVVYRQTVFWTEVSDSDKANPAKIAEAYSAVNDGVTALENELSCPDDYSEAILMALAINQALEA